MSRKEMSRKRGGYFIDPLEKFGGPEYAIIVTDEEGMNKIFNTPDEAQAEADDCQDGIVVEIN